MCPQSRHWKMYLEHEMKEKNYVRVEDIFKKCLKQVFLIAALTDSLPVPQCGTVEALPKVPHRALPWVYSH